MSRTYSPTQSQISIYISISFSIFLKDEDFFLFRNDASIYGINVRMVIRWQSRAPGWYTGRSSQCCQFFSLAIHAHFFAIIDKIQVNQHDWRQLMKASIHRITNTMQVIREAVDPSAMLRCGMAVLGMNEWERKSKGEDSLIEKFNDHYGCHPYVLIVRSSTRLIVAKRMKREMMMIVVIGCLLPW